MPNWKKLIVSGSDAILNSLIVTNGLTVTGSASISSSIFFSNNDTNITTAGQLGWDAGNGTLDLGLSGSAGAVPLLKVGQQLIARVYNAQGSTITKGQVVYVSGSQGNRIAVKLAAATDDSNSAGTLGLVIEDIANGAEGYIATEGPLSGLNTSALTAGALLYLSSSAGQYTQTKPVAPIHEVRLGYVERVHASAGTIYIKVDNGYEIDELHNVLISSPSSSGDLLVLSSSLWINSKQLTGSYGLTGSLRVTNGGITGSLLGTASYATNALTASYALTAGVAGSGTTFAAGNTNNRVVTATGTTPELNGEANLTFDGSTLAVTGNVTATSFTGSLRGTASVATSVYFTASNANINYGISLGPQVGDVGNATVYTKTGYSINPSEYSNTGLLDANNIRVGERLIIKKALLMSRGLGVLQASNYVIGDADLFVLVDTQFAVDIDLRAAENADNDGRVLVIKDGAGNAATNPITFTSNANIEAGTGYSPDDNWESIVMVWDNSLNTWWVIAKFIP